MNESITLTNYIFQNCTQNCTQSTNTFASNALLLCLIIVVVILFFVLILIKYFRTMQKKVKHLQHYEYSV